MLDSCTLITQTDVKNAAGYVTGVTEITDTIRCSEKSVVDREFYAAAQVDRDIQVVLEIHKCEYSGQPVVEYGGKRYHVARTYKAPGGFLELHLETIKAVSGDASNGN